MLEKEPDYKSIVSLDSELNQIHDMDLLLERILLEARRVVRADAGSIYIKETAQNSEVPVDMLRIKYAQNDTLQKALPPGHKLPYSIFSAAINDKSQSGYCALTRTVINMADVSNIPEDAPYSHSNAYDLISGYITVSALTVPLILENQVFGVMQVFNSKDGAGNTVPFSTEDELIITHFASHITAALQRTSITRAMILRMIQMAELRDPKETGTHVNRVAGYAIEIYDRWAYHHQTPNAERDKFRDVLKIAAMLHDVGKVAISDVILKKPARFTPEEYAIMQNHTVYGAALFMDPHSQLDNVAQEIALTHHENWDGTGYPGWVEPGTGRIIKQGEDGKPLGRKGEEIPLTGRIVAIADVFDALCSRRAYKEPWDEEDVLAEIRKLSGTKFDPEIADIFFEILPLIKQIQSLYPEAL